MARTTLLSTTDASLAAFGATHLDRNALAKSNASAGTHTYSQTTVFRGGQRAMTTVGNYVEFQEQMTAGTWTFVFETNNAASGGSFTVAVDGVTVGTIDTYNAANTPTRTELAGVVIAATGKHLIRLTVTTKNPSASADTCRIAGYSATRTGA